MSILVFQHESNESAGVLGDVLQRHGHRLRTIRLDQGNPVPTDLDDVDGIVSMGGLANVDQTSQYPWLQPEMDLIKQAHEAGLPVVGICLGAQLIATALGGKVEKMKQPEIGWHPLAVGFAGTTDPIFAGVTWHAVQFHLHGQEVTELPAGSVPLASSTLCKHQAFKVGFTTYGFQFHFEWTLQTLGQLNQDGMFNHAGVNGDVVINDAEQHYSTYRRLGDRLCENLATYLFPIDKRVGR